MYDSSNKFNTVTYSRRVVFRVYMFVCVYLCLWLCVYVCVYVCVCAQTHSLQKSRIANFIDSTYAYNVGLRI